MFGRAALLVSLVAYAGLAVCGARAAPVETLYSFSGTVDGAGPQGMLAMGGVLYGTTHSHGGAGCYGNGCGTLYSIDPSGGVQSTLHAFQGPPTDGSYVFAGPIMRDHVLYGTASAGGPNDLGTIYRYDPATRIATVLHAFQGGPADGAGPRGGLLYRDGALYGTTASGGSGCGQAGCGTVFRLDLKSGAMIILYSFRGGADGAYPAGPVTYVSGALYGTTKGGDVVTDYGTVFRVDIGPVRSGETVLYHFAGAGDGAYPLSALTYEGGALFGTTQGGDVAADFGTVFRVDGITAQPKETVLHAFQGGSDGALPEAPVIFAGGALYGTTVLGGGKCALQSGCGTVFRLDPVSGAESVLHRFTGGAGGSYPEAGLAPVGHQLYGTTFFGGGGCNGVGCGTVFRIAQ